jgi:hypothetical protein
VAERDDGDVGLFRQTKPEPQGAVSRQVADKDVRERAVFLLFGASVTIALPVLHPGVATRLTVIDGRCIGSARRIRAGLFVLGADEATFDPHLAIMIEDHEGTSTHDVIEIIGLPLGLQPVVISLKLT